MRTLAVAAAALSAALMAAAGCGSEDPSGSGGSGGSGGGSSGPCVPLGTWEITYDLTSVSQPQCLPASDTMTLAEGANGTVEVTFAGDMVETDTCGATPTPATYLASATISADGCTVHAQSESSWCNSGEDQCRDRDLTLTISGNTASGSLTYRRCWCTGGIGDPFNEVFTAPASASRTSP